MSSCWTVAVGVGNAHGEPSRPPPSAVMALLWRGGFATDQLLMGGAESSRSNQASASSAGDIIIQQGDTDADKFYVIKSGR